MNEYDFTLKFQLGPADATPDAHIDALAASGCTDALVGIGQKGRIALNFTREALNAVDAITSAIADVHKAIPDARLIEASPDYVGITDLADLFEFSRQNMRKLIQNSRPNFPLPIHEGQSSVWHLLDVLQWFHRTERRAIPLPLLELAEVNWQVNLYKEIARRAKSQSRGSRAGNPSTLPPPLQSALDPVVQR